MKMTESPTESGDCNTKMMAYIPAMVHQHLDAIQHNSEGGVFLGASSLTGRYWMGSLWYFADPSTAPDIEQCTAGVDLDTGLNDFKLLSDRQLLVGNDTGSLQLWELKNECSAFSCERQQQEHDGFVSALSINADKKQVVTCSQDRRVKIWDLEEFVTTDTFTAHHSVVWSVACHPTESSIFLSCGQDGRTLLWDLRKPKPAKIMDTSALEAQPTCVVWDPKQKDSFVVGSESGTICRFDCRTPTENASVLKPHNRIVHRMAFSPDRAGWLATASDDCIVAVSDLSASDPAVVWSSDCHTDFVRGLSWSPTDDKLMSCGWDLEVFTHSVSAQSATIDMESVRTPGSSDLMDTTPPVGTTSTNGI